MYRAQYFFWLGDAMVAFATWKEVAYERAWQALPPPDATARFLAYPRSRLPRPLKARPHLLTQWLSGSQYYGKLIIASCANCSADGTRASRPRRASSSASVSWHTQAPACSFLTRPRRSLALCPPTRINKSSSGRFPRSPSWIG